MLEHGAGEPSSKAELRNFCLVLGALFAVFFGLPPLWRRQATPEWPWIAAAILWLAALAWPRGLKWPYHGWTRLGRALGWFNTRAILTLIFVVLITPFGFVLWVFGRDRMKRGFDPRVESYRVPSAPHPPRGMEKPF